MNKIKRKIKELFIYFLRKIEIKSIFCLYIFLSVTHAQFDQCQDFWLPVMDYPRASRSSTRGSQARGTRLPLIGYLIISRTHSLLTEIRAILIIQQAKYKLVYLTRLFIASLTLRLHSAEQYIHKHYTNYTIQKYIHRKITQCKLQAAMRPYVHNKYFNWLTLNKIQCFNTLARVLKRTRDVILLGNIIF